MDKNTAVIYIPKKLKDELKKLAKRKGYKLQGLSEIMVREYISKNKSQINL